jgi:hypothetical protein
MFNEFGLGGGMSECGDTPGTDYKIGLFPWLGVTTSYEASKDPFKASPAAKTFLVNFYQAALRLLKQGGGKWPVHHSYIWNCVSWDVQVGRMSVFFLKFSGFRRWEVGQRSNTQLCSCTR